MKKSGLIVVIILIFVGVLVVVMGRSTPSDQASPSDQSVKPGTDSATTSNIPPLPPPGMNAANTGSGTSPQISTSAEEEEEIEENIKPATELYKTAEEALKAIKDGAVDYDDIVLEQFTQPGENCTWCDTLYKWVKDLMTSPDTKPDQKSFYAEVLAISGRVDNIRTLVDAIKNAPNSDEGELYAEALELTLGNDDVVGYLGGEINTSNETLREAVVAAVTNQGSRMAVDLLYKNTVEKGDPDGYYSIGIGLGELVPETEAMPYLQEIVMKRDQYSHLGVKALLNSGLDGLKVVYDIISNSKNPDFDKDMLKGAVDHVSFDDDTESFLKQTVNDSKSEVWKNFAKTSLDEFALEEEVEAEDATP